MKVHILLDDENIVRCIASHESNLHEDKLFMMNGYLVERGGTVGDEYDSKTDTWTPRPENYPQPSTQERIEAKIAAKEIGLLRDQAIARLKEEEDPDFPPDYTDTIGVAK